MHPLVRHDRRVHVVVIHDQARLDERIGRQVAVGTVGRKRGELTAVGIVVPIPQLWMDEAGDRLDILGVPVQSPPLVGAEGLAEALEHGGGAVAMPLEVVPVVDETMGLSRVQERAVRPRLGGHRGVPFIRDRERPGQAAQDRHRLWWEAVHDP